jgi:hypothetical protein
MRVGREVERHQSADGKHILRIFRRDAEFYFIETSELTEGGETFWAGTKQSGLHRSLEAAKQDALAVVPWLNDLL